MADPTTQQRTRTGVDPAGGDRTDTPGRDPRSRTPGVVSLLAGAGGVVAAIPPGLGVAAVALAVLAVVSGVPAMREGPSSPCYSFARTGVVLGMIAALLGFLSLAMQLLG